MLTKTLMLLTVVAACCCTRPAYIGCLSTQECGKNACCVIGMGRYSIPTCQPYRDAGEICRPAGEPTNTTLHYPDGVTVRLNNVFYLHCPCYSGLTCDRAGDTTQCVDSLVHNHVSEYSDEMFEY